MASKSKRLVCLLILTWIVSTLMIVVVPAYAFPRTSEPLQPEFTIRLDDYSYTTSPTYTTDPYTGEQKIVSRSEYVSNKTIWIMIKNQYFVPYEDYGNEINLYYNISYKGHYSENWTIYPYYLQDYQQEYTTIKILSGLDIPKEGSLDFKVKTQIGYFTQTWVENQEPFDDRDYHIVFTPNDHSWERESHFRTDFFGQVSNWSSIQTLDVGGNKYTPNPTMDSLSSENNQNQLIEQIGVLFGFGWELVALLVAAVVIAVLAVSVLVLWRSRTSARKQAMPV